MVREIVIAICDLKGCKGKLELIAETEYSYSENEQTHFYECNSCGTIFREDIYFGFTSLTTEAYKPSKLTKEEAIKHAKGAYGYLDENKIIAKRK